MLDKRSLMLLESLNAECLNSGYKIFLLEELVAFFPKALGLDKDVVLECLKMLSAHEYVSIKYKDDEKVCLCPTSKGRLVSENRIEEQIERQNLAKNHLIYSFLGSFIGSAIVSIVAFIILLLGGRL